MGELWLNKQGEPISLEEWSRLHQNMDYRVVAQEFIGPYFVSTVWLGLDHNFSPEGPPLIFETMVFVRPEVTDSMGLDLTCRRYATEDEARQGHFDMVTLISATYQPIEAEQEETNGHRRDST